MSQIEKGITEIGQAIMITMFTALILGSILGISLFANIEGSGSVVNQTDAWINETGWTLDYSTLTDFAYTNLVILNSTDNSTIGSGNYTVTDNVLYNATAQNYDLIRVSYDYTYETSDTLSGVNINALSAIFAAFVVAVFAFVVIGGTLMGILWILPYIKPLFKKNALGMSA